MKKIVRKLLPRSYVQSKGTVLVGLPKTINSFSEKGFQPIKQADLNHPAPASMNRNFLPILLSPCNNYDAIRRTMEIPNGTASLFSTRFDLNERREDHIWLRDDPRYGVISEDTEPDVPHHLPTHKEFQIFVSWLAFATKHGTNQLIFKSWESMCEHLGMPTNGGSISLLKRTLFTFYDLEISFKTSYVVFNNATQKEIIKRESRGFRILHGFGVYKEKHKKGSPEEVKILIDGYFLNECFQQDFTQIVDAAKVMKFKSPRALSLYLYLLRWSEVKTAKLTRNIPEPLNFVYDYLGWKKPDEFMEDGTPNKAAAPSRIKDALHRALDEIRDIDPRFNFELSEQAYKNKQILFVPISATETKTFPEEF